MFITTCIKILKNCTDIKFFQIVKKKKFKDSSIIERTKMKKKKSTTSIWVHICQYVQYYYVYTRFFALDKD